MSGNEKFILVKNFLTNQMINHYLKLSKKYKEADSKVGTRVGKERKIRKDIFFSMEDCEILDTIMYKYNHNPGSFIQDQNKSLTFHQVFFFNLY